MLDVVVIGSGPNGLVAAATAARAGLKVLVLETQDRPGGAAGTAELTEPGFKHDIGAGFFPFGPVSEALRSLDLEGAGLSWCYAPIDSAHVASDGTCGVIARDLDRTYREMGRDAGGWAPLAHWMKSHGQRLVNALLDPLPALGPFARVGLPGLLRFGTLALSTAAEAGERLYRTPAGQRILPGLALHADMGPDDIIGGSLGITLGLLASWSGFGFPRGGAGEITAALLQRLEESSVKVRLRSRAKKIIVRGGAVHGVILESGEEIEARAVIADTGPTALLLDLVGAEHLSGRVASSIRKFEYAWGTFKVDWALDGPVPWLAPAAREASVVHLGESVPSLRSFTTEVREGKLPEHPFLLVGQQSLADPTRAPPGKHTLYSYTHVPSAVSGGWKAQREVMADRLEAWIEADAPGFKKLIRSRSIHTPPDFSAMNENLVGGDNCGGTAHVERQLFLRPVFPYFRYRMPIDKLYLCSASTHPGAGVHGASGYSAGKMAVQDLS